jgi:hypothetical protein
MNPECQILKIFQRLAKFVRILLDLTASYSVFISQTFLNDGAKVPDEAAPL